MADALEHIDPISVGIDAVQAAGDDQALHDPYIGRAEEYFQAQPARAVT